MSVWFMRVPACTFFPGGGVGGEAPQAGPLLPSSLKDNATLNPLPAATIFSTVTMNAPLLTEMPKQVAVGTGVKEY